MWPKFNSVIMVSKHSWCSFLRKVFYYCTWQYLHCIREQYLFCLCQILWWTQYLECLQLYIIDYMVSAQDLVDVRSSRINIFRKLFCQFSVDTLWYDKKFEVVTPVNLIRVSLSLSLSPGVYQRGSSKLVK